MPDLKEAKYSFVEPSLSLSDALRLNSEKTIGINKAFDLFIDAFETQERDSNKILTRIKAGFKTNRELHDFLKQNLGLTIPHKKNCYCKDHCAPFQYVADFILNRIYDAIVIGNRGGAKSHNAGLIQWVLANFYPKYEGKTLGGSADQSMKSYEAMLDFWDRAGSDSKNVLIKNTTKKLNTQWKTGSSISILTASQKSVRGTHPNTLCVDYRTNVVRSLHHRPIGNRFQKTFKVRDLEIGNEVLAFDPKTHEIAFKKVIQKQYVGEKAGLEIFTFTGEHLKCSTDHRILTLTGWKEAGDLVVGEKVYTVKYFPIVGCRDIEPMLVKSTVVSITKKEVLKLYDITVEDYHTFFAGGIATHNCLDECDEMEYPIYEAAIQTPMFKNNIPSRMLVLSTYHKSSGTMSKILGDTPLFEGEDEEEESIIKNNRDSVKVYKYCIFETLESCRDYSCSTCPLSSFCVGTHMKEAVGYYKIEDFAKKLKLMSTQTLKTEWLCKKPSRKGLVFTDFDERMHVTSVGYNPDLPVDLSIDFGFSKGHFYCVGVYQDHTDLVLPDGRLFTGSIMVDEMYLIPKTNMQVVEMAKKKPWGRYPSRVWGVADNQQISMINEWNSQGFRVSGIKKGAGSIISGINKLLGVLSPVSGTPKFLVNRKCKGFLTEKDNYKWGPNGEPIDKDNHSVDQTRYRFMARKKKSVYGGVKTT